MEAAMEVAARAAVARGAAMEVEARAEAATEEARVGGVRAAVVTEEAVRVAVVRVAEAMALEWMVAVAEVAAPPQAPQAVGAAEGWRDAAEMDLEAAVVAGSVVAAPAEAEMVEAAAEVAADLVRTPHWCYTPGFAPPRRATLTLR